MATNEEHDLIGYDPLAWMDAEVEENAETSNDSGSEIDTASSDGDAELSANPSDELVSNPEESLDLDIIVEDELASEEIDEGNADISADAVEDSVVEAMQETTIAEATETAGMDSPQLDLEPTLTIQNVVKLHEKLKGLVAVHDQIEINASDVSSIDTATLQLLVALKKDASKLNKQVDIIYPSPRFVESARLLGLLNVLDVQDV